MPVALKLKAVEKLSRRGVKRTYEPTFSGNYPGPGGPEPLDFTKATNPSFLPAAGIGCCLPEEAYFENPASDHQFKFVPGTTLADAAVLITVANTGVQLANIAYPAAVTTDDANMRLIVISKF